MDIQDKGIVAALAGVGIFEIYKTYANCVPPMHELTSHPGSDGEMQAALTHADVMTGGLALVAGAWFAYHLRSPLPLLLVVLVFGMVSVWHHQVLNA